MPEYFYDDPEWDARQRAGKITLPILVLGFDDDPWANTEAISRLLAPAQNAKIERREIRRADYGLSSIGHMGFFRTRNAEKLWPLVAQWLERHCPDKRADDLSNISGDAASGASCSSPRGYSSYAA